MDRGTVEFVGGWLTIFAGTDLAMRNYALAGGALILAGVLTASDGLQNLVSERTYFDRFVNSVRSYF